MYKKVTDLVLVTLLDTEGRPTEKKAMKIDIHTHILPKEWPDLRQVIFSFFILHSHIKSFSLPAVIYNASWSVPMPDRNITRSLYISMYTGRTEMYMNIFLFLNWLDKN